MAKKKTSGRNRRAVYVVLGGYGEMGKIAARDLVATAKDAVVVITGKDEKKAADYTHKLAKEYPNAKVQCAPVDVTDQSSLVMLLKGADVCVNCVTYRHNLDVMEACLAARCHYLDLGGLFHMSRKQLRLNEEFRKRNLVAILGCGSTPGITNVMAGYGAAQLDHVDEVHVKFAGHDFTKYDVPFVVPYSMYTVFDEFSDKPAVFRKGEFRFVHPLTGQEKDTFPQPVGEVTSFYTLHSEVATFPLSFKKKGIKECSFRVAFPTEFVNAVKFLVETGLASKDPVDVNGVKVRARDVTVKELNRFIPDGHTKIYDLEYVRVELLGKRKGKQIQLTMDCLAKSSTNWNVSAGAVDTGVPPSIIAQMIASSKVKPRGVVAPEIAVDPSYFFNELRKRGMEVSATWKEVLN